MWKVERSDLMGIKVFTPSGGIPGGSVFNLQAFNVHICPSKYQVYFETGSGGCEFYVIW